MMLLYASVFIFELPPFHCPLFSPAPRIHNSCCTKIPSIVNNCFCNLSYNFSHAHFTFYSLPFYSCFTIYMPPHSFLKTRFYNFFLTNIKPEYFVDEYDPGINRFCQLRSALTQIAATLFSQNGRRGKWKTR